MRQQKYSGDFSKYYDTLALAYWNYKKPTQALAKILKGRKNVLEVGVGTGLVAITLAKMGFAVTGIDYSDEMFSILRKKLARKRLNLTVRKYDARNFKFPRKFDAIYSHSGAFVYLKTKKGLYLEGYMLNKEDYVKSFKNIARHLKNGGLFAISIQPEHESVPLLKAGNGLFYKSRVTFNKNIMTKEHLAFRNNKIVMRQTLRKMRFPYKEIKKTLERIGFRDFRIDKEKTFVYCYYEPKQKR